MLLLVPARRLMGNEVTQEIPAIDQLLCDRLQDVLIGTVQKFRTVQLEFVLDVALLGDRVKEDPAM